MVGSLGSLLQALGERGGAATLCPHICSGPCGPHPTGCRSGCALPAGHIGRHMHFAVGGPNPRYEGPMPSTVVASVTPVGGDLEGENHGQT